MVHLQGEYCFVLNSHDKYDPELPLVKTKANGGTMVLWKVCHDPYISLHPVSSPSILPVIFNPPHSLLSIHVAVYLPTHGQDSKFVEELSCLEVCLKELHDLFPNAPVFLRGDFNVNANNTRRSVLLENFCEYMDLTMTPLQHKTYHHFTGNGSSDSELDKLIFSNDLEHPENVTSIICKLENPAVDSHHDIIISEFHLTLTNADKATCKSKKKAPKVENNRRKVCWSDEGIKSYQDIVIPELLRIQKLWLVATTPSKTPFSCVQGIKPYSNLKRRQNKQVCKT